MRKKDSNSFKDKLEKAGFDKLDLQAKEIDWANREPSKSRLIEMIITKLATMPDEVQEQISSIEENDDMNTVSFTVVDMDADPVQVMLSFGNMPVEDMLDQIIDDGKHPAEKLTDEDISQLLGKNPPLN